MRFPLPSAAHLKLLTFRLTTALQRKLFIALLWLWRDGVIARGCLRTLRVRLAPNLPSESFRFLQHIYLCMRLRRGVARLWSGY